MRSWFPGMNNKYLLNFLLFTLLFIASNFNRLLYNFWPLIEHLCNAFRNFCINTLASILAPLPIRNLLLMPAKQLEGSQTKIQDLDFSWTNIKRITKGVDYQSKGPNLS